MRDAIEIQDLYEGAYLICQGFSLDGLDLRGTNGRKVVSFIISGEGIKSADAEYRAGRAMANVALLKFTMDQLKDQMFARIREREREESTHHEARYRRGA